MHYRDKVAFILGSCSAYGQRHNGQNKSICNQVLTVHSPQQQGVLSRSTGLVTLLPDTAKQRTESRAGSEDLGPPRSLGRGNEGGHLCAAPWVPRA